ncbi:class I SAM-dependent methyltransferase [Actinoplanes sp. TBRC 11911]|uniref:class I SAM-dependent methyltransferase n=1 Tax=Actinoplanes sp. TBRC 11911 TaxID=2729386 RepID=UPI00145C975D|nr:class I SAM-dependent methyltransferase [Actinoplanes sp. TBRC 11911]NMO55223.1 class I SAM-dependent methyltransferase [Actinoplanes sp. TBRC 11911]
MPPFAVVALDSGAIAITSVRCPRHGGFARLADLPDEHLDRVRFLRGIISHFHRDEGVEAELSIEDATGPAGGSLCLVCLPDATGAPATVPAGALALPEGIYDLHRAAADRKYTYVERKTIDETVSPERAQRERWQGWLVSAAPHQAAAPGSGATFRGWLPRQDRYAGSDDAGVWTIDFFRSVRRTNQAGSAAVAGPFLREWSAASAGEGAVRFAGHLRGSGPAEILDAGCGPAVHHAAFAELGLRPTGIDLSPVMLAAARTHSGAALVQGDVGALPFRDGRFAGVWLRAVLVHVPRAQLPGTLREARRVLAGDGTLYLNLQPGRGLTLRREGRTFVYHDESDVVRLCRSLGLHVIDRWSDSVGHGSLGDTRVKQWRHLVLRAAEGETDR